MLAYNQGVYLRKEYTGCPKTGTNGIFNYFSYFYLQVKVKVALTLDERVETLHFGDS
jgi:hypothetical protein